MSNYEIYRKMFDNCKNIEDIIRESISKMNGKIYNIDVFVGCEKNEQYELFVECVLPRTGYRNIRGLYTMEEIKKVFHIK